MPIEPESGRSVRDGGGVTADAARAISMAHVFWFVACADIVLILAQIAIIRTNPMPFGAVAELFLLGLLGVLGAITVIAALIRNGVAYGIGLALLIWPLLYFGALLLAELKNAAVSALH
jgi:hypothetical protein